MVNSFLKSLFIFFVVCFFIGCRSGSLETEVLPLPELRFPAEIYVQADSIYITHAADEEGRATEVFIYSTEDFKLKSRFGGDGKEPGKFSMAAGHSIWVSFPGELIAVDDGSKLGFFSKQGDFLREMPTPEECAIFRDIGDGFVAQKSYYDQEGVHIYAVALFDAEMNFIKELHRQENAYNPVTKKNRVFTRDLHFITYLDKVFIKGRPEDFVIHVFDRKGERVRTIEIPYERVPVTEVYKQGTFELYREHPLFGRYFDTIKEEIVFPELLPAIRRLRAADNRIYALMYRHDLGMAEFYILDLEGGLLDRKTVPFKWRYHIHPQPFDIRDGRLYQLVKNDQTGLWELHITGLI